MKKRMILVCVMVCAGQLYGMEPIEPEQSFVNIREQGLPKEVQLLVLTEISKFKDPIDATNAIKALSAKDKALNQIIYNKQNEKDFSALVNLLSEKMILIHADLFKKASRLWGNYDAFSSQFKVNDYIESYWQEKYPNFYEEYEKAKKYLQNQSSKKQDILMAQQRLVTKNLENKVNEQIAMFEQLRQQNNDYKNQALQIKKALSDQLPQEQIESLDKQIKTYEDQINILDNILSSVKPGKVVPFVTENPDKDWMDDLKNFERLQEAYMDKNIIIQFTIAQKLNANMAEKLLPLLIKKHMEEAEKKENK